MTTVKGKGKTGVIDRMVAEQGTNTTRAYRLGVARFLRVVYNIDIDTNPENGNLEKVAARYVKEHQAGKRDLVKDFKRFVCEHQTGTTIFVTKTAVLRLLKKNGIHPAPEVLDEMKDLRCKRKTSNGEEFRKITNKARTFDASISAEDIRQIMNHLNLRDRAIVLLMASSGARADEILGLSESALRLDRTPAEIRIVDAKDDSDRIAYISREAVETLKTYITAEKPRGRLFDISYSHFRRSWIYAITRAGLDSRDEHTQTKRYEYHPHGLRKFFLSMMKTDGMNPDLAEGLAGHSGLGGYLREAYSRIPVPMRQKAYLDHEDAVAIMSPRVDQKQGAENRELRDRLALMETQVATLIEIIRSPSAPVLIEKMKART